jgi:hypothetical protein
VAPPQAISSRPCVAHVRGILSDTCCGTMCSFLMIQTDMRWAQISYILDVVNIGLWSVFRVISKLYEIEYGFWVLTPESKQLLQRSFSKLWGPVPKRLQLCMGGIVNPWSMISALTTPPVLVSCHQTKKKINLGSQFTWNASAFCGTTCELQTWLPYDVVCTRLNVGLWC